MKVLVACEYSGVVRDAFRQAGHDAMSCDLLPTDSPGHHYQGDVRDLLDGGFRFDLMIAHPPCTYLTVAGYHWNTNPNHKRGHVSPGFSISDGERESLAALEFVRMLMNAPIEKIAVENPVSIISGRIRKPDQTIQPWQYGHGEVKRTCLWLKNLPKLTPTNIVEGREQRVHRMPPGVDRWKERSRTLQGIADAMAAQWGNSK